MHNQINSIYQKRLSKYLNLLSIHGNRNNKIVNSIFNERKEDEQELGKLQQEIMIARRRQKQSVDIKIQQLPPNLRIDYEERKRAVSPKEVEMSKQLLIFQKPIESVEPSTFNTRQQSPYRLLSPNSKIQDATSKSSQRKPRIKREVKQCPCDVIERIKYKAGVKSPIKEAKPEP